MATHPPTRRFTFRLQTVLEQRERIEQEQQRRVAELDRQRIALEEQLRQCQRSIVAARTDLKDRLSPGAAGGAAAVRVEDVRLQASASLHLTMRARQVALELAGAHQRLEAARRELLKATTARKAVSLLRERRLAEWKQETRRRETGDVDELTVMRHGRGSEPA